jgi:threonine dehydrogenase-like Zn-dependent dehydrogenase
MTVGELPEPGEPGPGEVVVRPEAVGLCGSDFHYFMADLGTDDAPHYEYPRVQGHEVSALVEAAGPDCPPELRPGTRVAIWPVGECGECYSCRLGRGNACVNLRLIGIHWDGGLQERVIVPAKQLVPIAADQPPEVTALVEPVSIAVRSVRRGRVAAGERVAVLGAGPIGQALTLASIDLGAKVLLVDRVASRLPLGDALGAETMQPGDGDDLAAAIREWAGDDGPDVLFEATGVPALVQTCIDAAAHAGRVVVVGLSDRPAPVRVGDLPFKELDVLGSSCCSADDFAEAAALVARRRELAARFVTHQFPLAQAPEAMRFSIENPAEVIKTVVRVDQ